MSIYLFLAPVFAYILGSIPFGLILTRLFRVGDLRKIGSGNIGATNVLRTGHKTLAALTLFLDAFKGAVAVLTAQVFVNDLMPLGVFDNGPGTATISDQSFFIFMMGAFAVLGHMFPIWLRFKGGKGVATYFGAMLMVFAPIGITTLIIWLSTALITRYSSVAALMATGFCCLMFWGILLILWTDPLVDPTTMVMTFDLFSCLACTILTLLVWLRHHANLERLVRGTEPKIGHKST